MMSADTGLCVCRQRALCLQTAGFVSADSGLCVCRQRALCLQTPGVVSADSIVIFFRACGGLQKHFSLQNDHRTYFFSRLRRATGALFITKLIIERIFFAPAASYRNTFHYKFDHRIYFFRACGGLQEHLSLQN